MGSGTARVHVGLPTRNTVSGDRLGYLRTAVASVVAQTWTDWRLVVSENGAEPGVVVAEVLAPYARDERIVHSRTGADLSAAGNCNGLIRAGDAPYVALLHDDDWWEPGFLERRVQFLDEHPDCAYVFGGNLLVGPDGQEIGRSSPALGPGLHAPQAYVPLLLRREGMPMPPAALVRRSAYEAVGEGFDERFPGWDYDMHLRLAVRAPVGYLDVWDSAFRIHPEQDTYSERWGERKVAHEQVIDSILGSADPGLRLPRRERLRRLSGAYLTAALDEVEAEHVRRALALAARGVLTHPTALVNPRLATVVAVAVGGRRVRPGLVRARTLVRRRGYLRRRLMGRSPSSATSRSARNS